RIQELAGLGEESLELLVKILSSSGNGTGNGTHNGLHEIEICTERINVLEKMGDKITQSFEEMLGRGSITASIEYDFGRLADNVRSEEHTSELQSRGHLVCRLLLEKKK